MEKILTIAMPSYNRCDILSESLGNLFSQIRAGKIQGAISIRVSDNCSTDNTFSKISQMCKDNPDIDVSIKKTVSHVGVDESMDLAARLSQTEWTWLLCDDDRVTSGSLEYILKKLQEIDPSISFMTFATNVYNQDLSILLEDNSSKYPSDQIICGVSAQNLDIYKSYLLLSQHIFRTKKWMLLPNKEKYYGSIFLQMYVLFYWINKNEKILFLNRVCLDYRKDNSVKDEDRLYEIFYGFDYRLPQIITDTISDVKTRQLLLRAYFFPFHLLSFRKVESASQILPSKRITSLFNASLKYFSFMPEFWILYPWQALTPPIIARGMKFCFDKAKPNKSKGSPQ